MASSPILEYIRNLNDNQLRIELGKNGIKAGPLTPATRRIWKTRLAKKLGVHPTTENSTASNVNEEKASSQQTPQVPLLPKVVEQTQAASKKKIEKQQFFGVFIPRRDSETENCEPLVFESKSETLLTTKGHKGARFKAFSTQKKAIEYSLKGEKRIASKNQAPKVTESDDVRDKFPSLMQKDLNKLMRLIENGTWAEINSLVWSNPKYLVNADDGPVILKQRPRYNALHIAAKANRPDICREILLLLENLDFQNLLFPIASDDEASMRRANRLLDLYLNMPDTILYETPLHFACKLGYKEVVSVLIAYPQCSTTLQNESGKTPSEIVCSRAAVGMAKNNSEIDHLLEEQYYVPLYRCHDNSENAVVGTPITLKQKLERIIPFSHFQQNLASPCTTSSPRPSLVVSALAGPMSKEQASLFRKSWMAPSKRKDMAQSVKFLRRADNEKGDEQIGRQIAANDDVRWTEFWDFLNEFTNFTTERGLRKLENFLQDKMPASLDLKPSVSRDIAQLSDMLQDMHVSEDGPRSSVKANQINITFDSLGLKSSGISSSFETETESSSLTGQNVTKSTQTMKTSPSNNFVLRNRMRPFYHDGDGTTPSTHTGSDLVKKLFTDDENSMEKFTDDFSKGLSLAPCSGESTAEVNGLANQGLLEYRTPNDSHSDVFSSPSISDVSQISDTVTPQHCPLNMFLTGLMPTKLDRDVLVAIGNTCIDRYPNISRWRDSILSFPESERQKWGTPQKKHVPFFNSLPKPLDEIHSPRTPHPSSSPFRSFNPGQDLRRLLFKPAIQSAH